MLAYVFWHRPREDAEPDAYERSELDLHRALSERRPPGLLGSGTVKVPDLPWLAGGGYEDWYVVDGYAALGELARAAVDESHVQAHDRAAAMFASGTAGLYAVVGGAGEPEQAVAAGDALWLTRPLGSPCPPLAQLVGEGAATEASLWRRELVLGPAPEICVLHRTEVVPSVPPGWTPFAACRKPI